MAWVGVVEALVAGGVGLWLRHALPSADRGWTWVLWGAGFVVLVLSLALTTGGRRAPAAAADPEPGGPALPVVPPPPAVAAYPPELAGMWRDVIQAHLGVGALRGAMSQAAAARAILDGSAAGSATALLEAHLLREGYRLWARGEEPVPDLEPYRDVVDPEAVSRRRAALAGERERLAADWAAWRGDRPADAGSLAERLQDAETHEQHLAALLRRAEELALLARGYEALAGAGISPDRPGQED